LDLAGSGYQTLKKMRSGKSLSLWDSRRVDVPAYLGGEFAVIVSVNEPCITNQ
jgi:hypothetical protein